MKPFHFLFAWKGPVYYVREKSGNFTLSQGKVKYLKEVGEE